LQLKNYVTIFMVNSFSNLFHFQKTFETFTKLLVDHFCFQNEYQRYSENFQSTWQLKIKKVNCTTKEDIKFLTSYDESSESCHSSGMMPMLNLFNIGNMPNLWHLSLLPPQGFELEK
jgi:hypothetical protein